jgi:hypothetical protein
MHRPLSAWMQLLLGAGFIIDAIREPRPSADDVRADPGLAKTRDRPAFLHVRCVQPAEGAPTA